MTINKIKDFLNNLFESINYKIKDSVIFNTLIEKYDHLEIHYQKWIKISALIIFILIILAFPFSIFISSIQSIHEFKNKKYLTLKLIQSESQNISNQEFFELELDKEISKITNHLDSTQIYPLNSRPVLSPKLRSLKYSGKKIEIHGINIKEVIEIGQKLNSISPSVKLIQFTIKELEDKSNYFKANYTLIHFHTPNPSQPIIKPLIRPKKSA